MKIGRSAWAFLAVGIFGMAGGVGLAADEAQSRGKAMVAAAKWRAPGIEGTWALRCEGAGPVIVLAEKSITALAKEDGKELWKVTEGVQYPTDIGGNDKIVLVKKTQSSDGEAPWEVTGISLADGTEKYRLSVPGSIISRAEQVRGSLIVVATGLATPIFGPILRPRPQVTPQLTGYDLNTGRKLWRRDAPKIEFLEGFISETEYLAILNDSLTLVDASTGESKWERPLESGWKGAGQVFRPDGTALFLEYREGTAIHRLLMLDLKTGKTVRNMDLSGIEGALEAASSDVLVLQRLRKSSTERMFDMVRTVELTEEDKKEKITAFEARSGKAQWTVAIPQDEPNYDAVELAGDVLLQGNPGSTWYKVPSIDETWTLSVMDMANGKTLWKRERVAGNPVVYKEMVIISGLDTLDAVDRRGGKTLWSIPTAGPPCEPRVVDGVLYIGVMAKGQTLLGRIDGICALGL
jgi:outer membrane protein assembly factor BamB